MVFKRYSITRFLVHGLSWSDKPWMMYLSLLSTRPQNVPESDLPLDFHNLTNQASPLCAQTVILCQPIIFFFGFHTAHTQMQCLVDHLHIPQVLCQGFVAI